MATPLATIGILSIGEMGLGIAKLLLAHNYNVVTNVSDRSSSTQSRARSAQITLLPTDHSLISASDYILSIVPPRDALATAHRIIGAAQSHPRPPSKKTPLYYIDLNAISPRSALQISSLFTNSPIRFIDGGIIGGAPKPHPNNSGDDDDDDAPPSWSKPSLVVSGPDALRDAPVSGPNLAEVLNIQHIAAAIGPASGLKMCFASTTKGFTAIAIQSFTTAYRLGVLPELQAHLAAYSPKTGELAAKGLVGMPPKAYRWVREMEEIADTMAEEGGFERDMFAGVSEVYRVVAEETELGGEKTESRKKGTTPEDVARLVGEGLERKKVKTE